MVITLGPDLEAALKEQAQRLGITSEELALRILRTKVIPPSIPEPLDEWERGLLEAARPCGVSIPDWALSREELYD